MDWVERILGWALPIDYLHGVFTLPHEFHPLILAGDEVFYRLIFASASATLSAIAGEKFGCRVGIVMVLHTWGQGMNLHVHVHVIVTCGGLSMDGSSWVPIPPEALAPHGDFSREVLADHYRQVFLRGVRRLFRRGELTIPPSMAPMTSANDLETWLAPVLRKNWCVDVQGAPPGYDGPKAVLNYLAGYVVGTAIHDRRILRYDGRCVVISAKNYRTGETEALPMTGEAFVRRFATHILPDRFQRIRYAGLFCARYRKGWLARCHELLGTTDESGADDESFPSPEEQVDERERVEPRPGPPCGHCGMPAMIAQGNRTAEQTDLYVGHLCAFFNRIFTWLTTMDIDRSTRSARSETCACVPAALVISCDSTWQSLETASFHTYSPIPDT